MADPGRFQPFENEAENQEFRELTLSQTNPEPPFLPHFEKAYPSEYPAEPTFPTHSAQQGPFPNQPPSPTPLHSTPNHGYGNDANNGHVEMADVASDTRPDHHLYLERQINVERFDVLYRRIVLYTTLTSWFVASWLFGLAYFLSGSFDDKFLWIAMLVGLGGAIVSTALTVIDRVMMKERYIDVVWYSMSLLIEIAPAGFAIAAVYKTIGSSEALCSTGLLMIIVPMCYTYVEMISRCVLSKLGSSQQMEVIT